VPKCRQLLAASGTWHSGLLAKPSSGCQGKGFYNDLQQRHNLIFNNLIVPQFAVRSIQPEIESFFTYFTP